MYLLPYSPDFNPIEQAFSAVKAYLRRHGQRMRHAIRNGGRRAPMQIYTEAVLACITPGKTNGWFRHCRY